MPSYGLTNLSHGIAKKYALRDMCRMVEWAHACGRSDLLLDKPDESASVKKIDRWIEGVMAELGIGWKDL